MHFLLGLVACISVHASPSGSPSVSPTLSPSPPTFQPTLQPTSQPSSTPSSSPTPLANTSAPSPSATISPTQAPTLSPTTNWENIPVNLINLTCGMTNAAYRQYEKMTPPLCLVISGKHYVAFYPDVDDFTLLEVENSFNASWLDSVDEPVYVRAEVGTTSSYWRTRSQGAGASKITVPFWTLVVEMTDGVVNRLTWDDSCPLCATSDLCVEGRNCGVAHSSCGNNAEANNCNLQIYLAWFGTDADGKYLTSSDKRLSRFRSGSLLGAYDSALKKANNIASIANPIPALTGGR